MKLKAVSSNSKLDSIQIGKRKQLFGWQVTQQSVSLLLKKSANSLSKSPQSKSTFQLRQRSAAMVSASSVGLNFKPMQWVIVRR